jgi:hypothetical protein
MSYGKQHFDKCFFNPLEKDLLKAYPRLRELIPEEKNENDKLAYDDDRLLRYILALYDPKSPVVKDNPDFTQRKIEAAIVAGYNLQKDDEKLEIIYSCDSDYMVAIIVNFLRNVVRSRLWASIQADEQVFWEFIARLHKPISEESDKDDINAGEKKIKLSQGKEVISTQIDANLSKFLGDDEDLKKKVKKQDFSPEAMAGIV